jgi:hypothetical protein
MAAWARGEDTPYELEFSEEDEEDEDEEGEVTLPRHSPLREALPSLDDIFCREAGIAIGARWPKQTWAKIRPSTSSPPQPRLALVAPDSGG